MRDQRFSDTLWFCVFDVGHLLPAGRVSISRQTYHIRSEGDEASVCRPKSTLIPQPVALTCSQTFIYF